MVTLLGERNYGVWKKSADFLDTSCFPMDLPNWEDLFPRASPGPPPPSQRLRAYRRGALSDFPMIAIGSNLL